MSSAYRVVRQREFGPNVHPSKSPPPNSDRGITALFLCDAHTSHSWPKFFTTSSIQIDCYACPLHSHDLPKPALSHWSAGHLFHVLIRASKNSTAHPSQVPCRHNRQQGPSTLLSTCVANTYVDITRPGVAET